MANETAAHREFNEKIAKKYGLTRGQLWQAFGEPSEKQAAYPDAYEDAVSAIDEAVRTALDKAAQAVMPDDFDKGSSEWCALCAAQAAIRSIVLRAEDVREEG